MIGDILQKYRTWWQKRSKVPISSHYRGWTLHYADPAANGYAVVVAHRKQLTWLEHLVRVRAAQLDDLYCVVTVNTYAIGQDWKTCLWLDIKQRIDQFENHGGLLSNRHRTLFVGPDRSGYVIDITTFEEMFHYELHLRGLNRPNA
ncbi:MAG: hypothetical protein WCD18_19765 [Thermosynechococcaceae cyanobacterium]